MKQMIVYLRPVKDRADVSSQLQEIRSLAGPVYPSTKIFREADAGATGILREVLTSLRSVTGCLFVVWRIDALADCFEDLPSFLRFVGDLLERDHDLVSVSDGLDTRREKGFILKAIADTFEERSTELKSERQRIAMHSLAAAGKTIGRPRRQDISPETVRRMKNSGQTIKAIAEELNTSPATIQRTLTREEDKSP